MSIEKFTGELLTEQDCVIVPGFGGFIAKYIPASIHPLTHVFTPPTRQVVFNASLRNNDGILANHLVRTLQISYAEALILIERQSAQWAVALNRGEKINIKNIGLLFSDQEQNIQFIPEIGSNFLDDAFGLSPFSSQPVEKMGSLQKTSHKTSTAVPSGRKLPSSIKWAAVLLPLAALSFWGAFNTDRINNLYSNSASVLPAPAQKQTRETVNPFLVTLPKTVVISETISSEPVTETISEPVLAAEKPDVTEIEKTGVDVNNYFIITGAFAVKENAEKLVSKLNRLGYPASIEGQNRKGLYRVSIEGFPEKDAALQKMAELRKGDFPGAWLFSLR